MKNCTCMLFPGHVIFYIFVAGTVGLSGKPGEQISVSHQELQKEVQPRLIDQQALVSDFLPGENRCLMCCVIKPFACRLHVR